MDGTPAQARSNIATGGSEVTSVTVTHRFAASAERVYDAWLDPDKARQFLYTTLTGEIVRCDIDARVGGRYEIVDRRNGEDVLHEGTYLELERPHRIVFTLRVPKYSPDSDRVTIEIKPLPTGCELTLTTQTAEEWAADTQRGWAMILDLLEETLPGAIETCGAGLAQHAVVPRRMAIYLAELARTLDLHRTMLVLDDENAKREDQIYRELSTSYRHIAAQLEHTAARMSAQVDLPMGAHDEGRWTHEHMKAFSAFVHEQSALASVLRMATRRDEQMLTSMQQGST
jgi:uncharacterized protein YndB with AHSA1/START domain